MCACVCVFEEKDLNVHTLRVGVDCMLCCSSLKNTVGLSSAHGIPPLLLLSLFSLSFLYTVLSQQPVGTVSHPFSVCTAKCSYPLASGYAFLSLRSFSLPTFSHLSLVSVLQGLSHSLQYHRLLRHARESCKIGV